MEKKMDHLGNYNKREQGIGLDVKRVEKELLGIQRERIKKSNELSSLVNKVENGERLEKQERERLANELENRGWQRNLTELNEGDNVVIFSSPEMGPQCVKNLNDKYLGPTETDNVIYDITEQALEESIKEVMEANDLDASHVQILDSPFKVKIAKCTDEAKPFIEQITIEASQKIQQKEMEMIEEKFQTLEDRIRTDGDPTGELNDEVVRYKKVKGVFEANPFNLTYGNSKVEKALSVNDYTNVELALSQAIQASKMEEGGIGSEFTYERAKAKIKEAMEIRDKYIAEGGERNQIRDKEGIIYNIFVEVDGEEGVYDVDPDLLQKVRKGELEVETGYEQVKKDLESLKVLVNSIDLVKPYIHEELAGKKPLADGEFLHTRVAETQKAVNVLRGFDKNGKDIIDDESEIHQLVQKYKQRILQLRQNPKDILRSSDDYFHEKALLINDCAAISMDVKGVGPEHVNNFFRLAQRIDLDQDINDVRKSIDDISIEDGDNTTKNMRDFRADLGRLLTENRIPEEEQIMKIGGDEVILALDSKYLNRKLLLKINRQLSVRLIDVKVGRGDGVVYMGTARRENGDHDVDSDENVEAHIRAIRASEEGTKVAKRVESFIEDLYLKKAQGWLYNRFSNTGQAHNKIVELRNIIKRNELKVFYIEEADKGFKIIHEDINSDGEMEFSERDYLRFVERIMGEVR